MPEISKLSPVSRPDATSGTAEPTDTKPAEPPKPAAVVAPVKPAAAPPPAAEKPAAPKPADAKPADAKGPQPETKPETPKPTPKKAETPAAPKPAQKPTVPQPARMARMEKRHIALAISFLLCVALPLLAATSYLYLRAADQFASTVGFSVRTEEPGVSNTLLSGLAGLAGGSSSPDTEVLYRFIQSPELVNRVDRDLGLKAMYSPLYKTDPWFALAEDATREDMLEYWNRMVHVSYDNRSGILEVRVNAFDPEAAQKIADTILSESTNLINKLSAIARDDATRYAKDQVDLAETRLRDARLNVAEFRSRTQMVDPSADVAGQMSLLTTLQGQLAATLIERDLLSQNNIRADDPRATQLDRRIAAIEDRMREERVKLGAGSGPNGQTDYAANIGEYERLRVEQEFAEKTYLMAMGAYDVARAEAQRKSRYLAAYQEPTLAETAEYPRRELMLGLLALFLVLTWTAGALVYYAVRDRR